MILNISLGQSASCPSPPDSISRQLFFFQKSSGGGMPPHPMLYTLSVLHASVYYLKKRSPTSSKKSGMKHEILQLNLQSCMLSHHLRQHEALSVILGTCLLCFEEQKLGVNIVPPPCAYLYTLNGTLYCVWCWPIAYTERLSHT